jgi:hypothetical protein
MSEMVNDDFTKTLNDFAAKFNVPAMEIYVLAAECIMVGKKCQREADIAELRARAKRDGPHDGFRGLRSIANAD